MDIVQNSFGKDKICMSEEAFYHIDKLRTWMFRNVYTNEVAKKEESKVKGIIYGLFNHYEAILKQRFPNQNEEEIKRTVCDYIAGMSDQYSVAKFEEIFVPASWKVQMQQEYERYRQKCIQVI